LVASRERRVLPRTMDVDVVDVRELGGAASPPPEVFDDRLVDGASEHALRNPDGVVAPPVPLAPHEVRVEVVEALVERIPSVQEGIRDECCRPEAGPLEDSAKERDPPVEGREDAEARVP